MPATARVPAESSASSATGTRSPTGANRMAESRGPGGRFTGEHVHLGSLGDRDLRRQMCTGPETVDPQTASVGQLCATQCPVADDAGAQQGRRLVVGVAVRDAVGV